MLLRHTLNLPNGWKNSNITLNHETIAPQANNSSYVWELRNLSFISIEPMSPSVKNLSPHIAANYAPDDDSKTVNRAFADWTTVSRRDSKLHGARLMVDDSAAAKARDLT